MKRITVTLTEDQMNAVARAVGNDFEDFMEDYDGEDKLAKANNVRARKENAYRQRILDKIFDALVKAG